MAQKALTMFAAGLLGLGITAASAAPVTDLNGYDVRNTAAPARFVGDGTEFMAYLAAGRIVLSIEPQAHIDRVCGEGAWACTIRGALVQSATARCVIIASDEITDPDVMAYLAVFHEFGHCKGWAVEFNARTPTTEQIDFIRTYSALILEFAMQQPAYPGVAQIPRGELLTYCERGYRLVIGNGGELTVTCDVYR